jgi:hypothetical protein
MNIPPPQFPPNFPQQPSYQMQQPAPYQMPYPQFPRYQPQESSGAGAIVAIIIVVIILIAIVVIVALSTKKPSSGSSYPNYSQPPRTTQSGSYPSSTTPAQDNIYSPSSASYVPPTEQDTPYSPTSADASGTDYTSSPESTVANSSPTPTTSSTSPASMTWSSWGACTDVCGVKGTRLRTCTGNGCPAEFENEPCNRVACNKTNHLFGVWEASGADNLNTKWYLKVTETPMGIAGDTVVYFYSDKNTLLAGGVATVFANGFWPNTSASTVVESYSNMFYQNGKATMGIFLTFNPAGGTLTFNTTFWGFNGNIGINDASGRPIVFRKL